MSDPAAPAKRKLRPARKQVKPGDIDKSEGPQPGKEYNVWYNKWAGGDKEDPLSNKTLAQSRCVISRDAGYTRADATGNRFCCLFFARGCCPYGHECNYLHRLPFPNQVIDHSRDCFGREKHADYRDDMGGVGSFNRSNRTLYVAKMQESPDKAQTKETLLRHFGEWGQIERWNILYNRGIAFVTYKHEVNAQFAKEAMANQSMDMDEIINVRWATEDPNPTEKIAEDKRIAKAGRDAISTMLDPTLVEAEQTLRALEDGDEVDYYPIEPSAPSPEPVEVRGAKRGRDGAGGGGGLIDEDALENIKFYADMARKRAEEDRDRKRAKPAAPAAKAGVGALLGGYASDSD
ncbi:Pre-mRNA-splicing factor [Cryptotrichosporon argae]